MNLGGEYQLFRSREGCQSGNGSRNVRLVAVVRIWCLMRGRPGKNCAELVPIVLDDLYVIRCFCSPGNRVGYRIKACT